MDEAARNSWGLVGDSLRVASEFRSRAPNALPDGGLAYGNSPCAIVQAQSE
jgi:hypothetical protein